MRRRKTPGWWSWEREVDLIKQHLTRSTLHSLHSSSPSSSLQWPLDFWPRAPRVMHPTTPIHIQHLPLLYSPHKSIYHIASRHHPILRNHYNLWLNQQRKRACDQLDSIKHQQSETAHYLPMKSDTESSRIEHRQWEPSKETTHGLPPHTTDASEMSDPKIDTNLTMDDLHKDPQSQYSSRSP